MATIIRHDDTKELPAGEAVRPVSYTLRDMSLQGDEYIERIRSEAAKIIQDATNEAEAIRKQAEQAGRDAAEQAIAQLLDAKVGQQMQTLRPALDKMVNQLDTSRGEWQDRWERSAIKLAVGIAERILREKLDKHPELALSWIREALQLAAGSSEIKVYLHPEDYKNLGTQVVELTKSIGRVTDAEVLAEASITLGGCRVQTKYGDIDMQLESQLSRLEEEIT